MKDMQFVIYNEDNKLFAQWDEDTILFDTSEEAKEFIKRYPKFFRGINYTIQKGIHFIDNSINYKDMAMNRTLQEVLDTDLSAENLGNYTPNELAKFLVDNGIVDSAADVNRIVIEGIQRILNEDDEFPIKYYDKNEEMPEEAKTVKNPGEMLTDNLVQKMKGVNK